MGNAKAENGTENLCALFCTLSPDLMRNLRLDLSSHSSVIQLW